MKNITKNMFKYIHILSSSIFFLSLFLLIGCEDDDRLSADLAVNNQRIVVPEEEGDTKILIYSTGSWQVSKEENTEWINIIENSGKGNGEFHVSFTENSENLPRSTNLIVNGTGRQDTILLCQRGLVPVVDITEDKARIIAKEGVAQTGIVTNIPNNLLQYSIEYIPEEQEGWLSNLRVESDFLLFDVNKNEGSLERESKVKVWYLDQLGVLNIDSIFIVQNPKSESDNAVYKDFEYIKTLEQGVIDEDIYIKGIVVSEAGNPNIATNPNLKDSNGKFHSVDYDENGRTIYLQSSNGETAIRIRTAEPGDNSFARFEHAEIWLKGLNLSIDKDNGSITLDNMTTSHIIDKYKGETIQPKIKHINELTDQDIYTYRQLKDVEISVPFGTYSNVHEGYIKRVDLYPTSIRDIKGNSMYMLTNMRVPYRRNGLNVPQGSGNIKGIIVSEKHPRFSSDLGRYSIRQLSQEDIELEEKRSDGFSKVLLEWQNWNAGEPGSNPDMRPDIGEGIIKHSTGRFYSHLDFSSLIGQNNGIRNDFSISSSSWWNEKENRGEYWLVETSSKGINQPLSLQLEAIVTVGGPRNWIVEWSTTGKESEWNKVANYTLPDQVEWGNTLLTQSSGFKTMVFKLPQAASNQEKLLIRLRVTNNQAGTKESDIGGTIDVTGHNFKSRLGHFSLKYNK